MPLWMYWQNHPVLALAFGHLEMGWLHSGHNTHLSQLVDYVLPSLSNARLILPTGSFERGKQKRELEPTLILRTFFLAQAREFSAC